MGRFPARRRQGAIHGLSHLVGRVSRHVLTQRIAEKPTARLFHPPRQSLRFLENVIGD
jgi:hypothetical protein